MEAGREAGIPAAFAAQAGHCARLGSPFTARLCRLAGERLDRATAPGRRILDWPGDPTTDALPLRLAGGLHALVRRGRLPALAACYPPSVAEDEPLWNAVAAALQEAGAELAPWLDGPPQTNEVARSAVLWTGLLHVAAMLGPRLELLELGASAGLNLIPDAYAYDLGGATSGRPDAPVRLAPAWEGPPPPDGPVEIAARRGVDLNPLDAGRAADRERLAAYVWADQTERLERVERALALAAQARPPIDRDDAADWLDARLSAPQPPGTARVVQHSIALQYFPEAGRRRIAAALAEAGARASRARPLAWLRYEIEEGAPLGATLRLRVWPSGADRLLAQADPHARRIVSQEQDTAMPRA